MFCAGCGAQLASDSRFCPSCGRATAVPAPASPRYGSTFTATGMAGIEGIAYLEELRRELSQTELMQLEMVVRAERKDYGTMMAFACIGFVGIAGINRFVMGEVGLGILWLLTFGLCGIGTIIDLVTMRGNVDRFNYDLELRLTNEFLVRKRVREGRP